MGAALALVAPLLHGFAAGALPVALFFDGPADGSGRRVGVSATSAADAHALGVPWISPALVSHGAGALRLVLEEVDPDSVSTSPPGQPPYHQGVVNGSVEALFAPTEASGGTGATLYVLFRSAGPGEAILDGMPTVIDYDETRVGLSLDPAAGWALLRIPDPVVGSVDVPALRIVAPAPGEPAHSFAVHEIAAQTLHEDGTGGMVWPRLRAELALVTVPEPHTGALLAVGLLALVGSTRRRRPGGAAA